ncbi:unnamed protein product [Rotaria sordida]|uniref:Glycosyl hydrolases family 39 N-terminal catalytic domain-containing protein n=1 Tax=Rotaria sordida TaxID=392033 RepID=A0A814INY2_9BILA|nr:unnamed protein product [Rotaria sordida]CAF3686207.1 unnamed protein product [Rotaria sordida]
MVNAYKIGSIEDYFKLYDYSVEAIKHVNKSFKIGGPATSDVGMGFLRQFLKHVTSGKNYVTNEIGTRIDFISFHTKGADYIPRRCYGHKVSYQSPNLSKILNDIHNNLMICNEFEQLNNLPIFIDECDPAVGTIYGVYDNPNYIICNTEYYPCIVASMIYHILSLSNRIQLITHWSFYMEGKRLFEGNRTLMTNYNLHLPILSGLKLFGKLKYKQLFIEMNQIQLPIFGIATCDDENKSFQLLLFYHVDDWTSEDIQSINITFINIPLQNILLKHYRIDSNHSNTYTEWIKIGKPDELNADQLEHLKHSQEIKLLHEPIEYKIENNQLKLAPFDLPIENDRRLEDINQRICYRLTRNDLLRDGYQEVFQEFYDDEETMKFMNKVKKNLIIFLYTNGLIGRGVMFVYSIAQFKTLLDIDYNEQYPLIALLHIGAGDGSITE